MPTAKSVAVKQTEFAAGGSNKLNFKVDVEVDGNLKRTYKLYYYYSTVQSRGQSSYYYYY